MSFSFGKAGKLEEQCLYSLVPFTGSVLNPNKQQFIWVQDRIHFIILLFSTSGFFPGGNESQIYMYIQNIILKVLIDIMS